jgi:hypothetical protein
MTAPNAIALLALAFAANAQDTLSQVRSGGPQTLAIAYRCNPDQRTSLRRVMAEGGVARFENWKKQGILKDYHILFNSYLDSETYDMLSLLTFEDFSGLGKWKEIEKANPGGLSSEAVKLVTSAITYSLDAVRHGASEQTAKPGRSVYFIIPYDYLIATEDYLSYLDGYVVPQANGWLAENVLAGYTMYISRYSTARSWGSLLVLEYRDHDAFGHRESTVVKVREQLKKNAAWVAASENKQKVRIEKQTIIAEELLPNR